MCVGFAQEIPKNNKVNFIFSFLSWFKLLISFPEDPNHDAALFFNFKNFQCSLTFFKGDLSYHTKVKFE